VRGLRTQQRTRSSAPKAGTCELPRAWGLVIQRSSECQRTRAWHPNRERRYALAFDGALTRISVSRPPQLAHVTGRMSTAGLSAPRAAMSAGRGTAKWRPQRRAVGVEPVAVGVELAEGVKDDAVGVGHRGLRLLISPDGVDFTGNRCPGQGA
jgi:hypothetical protein